MTMLKVTNDTIYITREMVEDAAYIPEWAHRRLKIVDFSKRRKKKMKIQFQAPKGKRIKKQFMCVELDNETDEGWLNWLDWRYYPESNEWRKDSDFKPHETYASSSCPCRSLKAAIRLIKKWNFPKGTTFRLCSIWMGYDVYITV